MIEVRIDLEKDTAAQIAEFRAKDLQFKGGPPALECWYNHRTHQWHVSQGA